MEDEYKGVPHVMLSLAHFVSPGSLRVTLIDPTKADAHGRYPTLAASVISPEEARDLARWIGLLVPPK